MLPSIDLLLDDVNIQFPCRGAPAKQLACFLSPDTPPFPAVVVHGLEATAKSAVLDLVLKHVGTPHAIVKSQECITGRHMLERTLTSCLDTIDAGSEQTIDRTAYARCENLSALTVHLQRLLQARKKFVIVFDRVDRQREAPPTLLPALARLNEYIPNLTVVLVVSSPRQRFLHRIGVPHIHFPSYTRDETLQIISRSPLPIFPDTEPMANDHDQNTTAEDDKWLWTRFCTAVYDSQGKSAARDVVRLRRLAEKLWQPFVHPIVDGSYGTRDFSKLMVAKRTLFQSEEMLTDRIVPPIATPAGTQLNPSAASGAVIARGHDLPYYSKYLLCAAYLASFNPPRTDAVFFMKSNDKKKRRRRRANANPGGGAASKHRKIPRRLLSPSAFPLERLLAIFHAILPYDVRPTSDLYTQLATLTSLRLLVKAGVGSSSDILDPSSAKWRANVGWEYVVALGRGIGFEVGEYVFDG